MSDKDLSRLKLERTQLRRRFTIDYNKLEDLFNAETVSVSEVELQFQIFNDKAERLFRLDSDVIELLFTLVKDENELAQEYDSTENYREKWLKTCGKSKYYVHLQ